jgi:hypothetical protein
LKLNSSVPNFSNAYYVIIIVPVAIVISLALSNITKAEAQPTSAFNVTQLFQKNGLTFVNVISQGNSTIVFRSDEESFIIPGAESQMGKAIDLLNHYGYKLDQVVTSGMGSQGNPTRFYVIMSKGMQ